MLLKTYDHGRVSVGASSSARPRLISLTRAASLGLAVFALPVLAQEAARTNMFGDPFVQATRSMVKCPVAEGPLVTAAEATSQAHHRAEKGTTCHYYGRCRLPNSYLYDKEIVPRVVRFIELEPRFADSTIWVLGQRRWVYLKGCAASAEQARAIEAQIRLIDDVEAVVNVLMVGTVGTPPYRTPAH